MEDKVCQFQKFGFCKYEEHCIKKHLSEECEQNSECNDKNNCQKRHSKACKRKGSGYRFEGDCAFSQKKVKSNVWVDLLEKVVLELSAKVLSQEIKIRKIKAQICFVEQAKDITDAMNTKKILI